MDFPVFLAPKFSNYQKTGNAQVVLAFQQSVRTKTFNEVNPLEMKCPVWFIKTLQVYREREIVQIFTTFVVFSHSSNRGCVNLHLFFSVYRNGWRLFIQTPPPPLSMRKICSMKCQKVIKIVSLVWILILQKRVQFEWFSWGEERNVDMPMKRWTITRENKWSSWHFDV